MRPLIYIFILAAILINGCDIFETRQPENPDRTKSNYITPSEPQYLIQNFINSFSDKNANNYLKSFATKPLVNREFSFTPSANGLSVYHGIWEEWTAADEFSYFNNLITKVPDELPITLTLSDERYTYGDSTIYTAEYSLRVPQINNEDLIYEGNLILYMKQNNQSEWIIYFWQDIAHNETIKSWSELKGENYL